MPMRHSYRRRTTHRRVLRPCNRPIAIIEQPFGLNPLMPLSIYYTWGMHAISHGYQMIQSI